MLDGVNKMLIKSILTALSLCVFAKTSIADVVIDPKSKLVNSELGYVVNLTDGFDSQSLVISIDETKLPKCLVIRELGVYNHKKNKVIGNYKWLDDHEHLMQIEISIDVDAADIENLRAVVFYKYVQNKILSEDARSRCSKFSNVAISRDLTELLDR